VSTKFRGLDPFVRIDRNSCLKVGDDRWMALLGDSSIPVFSRRPIGSRLGFMNKMVMGTIEAHLQTLFEKIRATGLGSFKPKAESHRLLY
jgi:hypothetical protein